MQFALPLDGWHKVICCGRAENNLDFIEEKWISRKLIEMEMERIEMEGEEKRELVYWMLVYCEVVVEMN